MLNLTKVRVNRLKGDNLVEVLIKHLDIVIYVQDDGYFELPSGLSLNTTDLKKIARDINRAIRSYQAELNMKEVDCDEY